MTLSHFCSAPTGLRPPFHGSPHCSRVVTILSCRRHSPFNIHLINLLPLRTHHCQSSSSNKDSVLKNKRILYFLYFYHHTLRNDGCVAFYNTSYVPLCTAGSLALTSVMASSDQRCHLHDADIFEDIVDTPSSHSSFHRLQQLFGRIACALQPMHATSLLLRRSEPSRQHTSNCALPGHLLLRRRLRFSFSSFLFTLFDAVCP